MNIYNILIIVCMTSLQDGLANLDGSSLVWLARPSHLYARGTEASPPCGGTMDNIFVGESMDWKRAQITWMFTIEFIREILVTPVLRLPYADPPPTRCYIQANVAATPLELYKSLVACCLLKQWQWTGGRQHRDSLAKSFIVKLLMAA